jgi:ATP-dependent RNA helicase DDX46/PRP5
VDHEGVKYQPFRKDFYVESAEVARMTEEEVTSYRNELDGIKIRGLKCPRPIRKWTHCGLNQRV